MFTLNGKPISRRELIRELIRRGQVVPYSKTRKLFRKEVSEDELPALYIYKKSRIIKAVVPDNMFEAMRKEG
jgi:hypothetical protein